MSTDTKTHYRLDVTPAGTDSPDRLDVVMTRESVVSLRDSLSQVLMGPADVEGAYNLDLHGLVTWVDSAGRDSE